MPRPAPLGCQILRSAGVALTSEGYHAKGKLTIRPSFNQTVSRSPSVLSDLIFALLEFRPGLQQIFLEFPREP